MNIAKGIKGIRKFLITAPITSGWHVTTLTDYIEYDARNAIEIIEDYSTRGFTFMGWTGNGLCFDENPTSNN